MRCVQVKGQQLSLPFPRLTYAEAMERYGCDKPDTRYGLELRTVSAAVAGSTFRCGFGPPSRVMIACCISSAPRARQDGQVKHAVSGHVHASWGAKGQGTCSHTM